MLCFFLSAHSTFQDVRLAGTYFRVVYKVRAGREISIKNSPHEVQMSKFIPKSTGLKAASRLLHHSKMPAFTLYGARGSTNSDRVRLTLAEGGFTDYELVLLNLPKGEQKVR